VVSDSGYPPQHASSPAAAASYLSLSRSAADLLRRGLLSKSGCKIPVAHANPSAVATAGGWHRFVLRGTVRV
jgi:hypothetical protein